jgi:hypothetical protein
VKVDRFAGGVNVPLGSVGVFKVGKPFGMLTMTDSRVILAVWLVSRLVRGGMTVQVSEIRVAYPARRRVLPSGVGIELADGRVLYFWTSYADQVLDGLGRRGVPLDRAPRQVTLRLR